MRRRSTPAVDIPVNTGTVTTTWRRSVPGNPPVVTEGAGRESPSTPAAGSPVVAAVPSANANQGVVKSPANIVGAGEAIPHVDVNRVVINNSVTTAGSVNTALIADNVPAVGAQLPRKSRKRTAATSSPAVNYGNWPQGVGESPANVVGAVEALPH
ncbi:hypothetical protein PCASD_06354, partial [Puccinia coronata f. sp. avenae]